MNIEVASASGCQRSWSQPQKIRPLPVRPSACTTKTPMHDLLLFFHLQIFGQGLNQPLTFLISDWWPVVYSSCKTLKVMRSNRSQGRANMVKAPCTGRLFLRRGSGRFLALFSSWAELWVV